MGDFALHLESFLGPLCTWELLVGTFRMSKSTFLACFLGFYMIEGKRAFTRHVILGIQLETEDLFGEKTAKCVYSAIRSPKRYASPIFANRTIDRIMSRHPHRYALHKGGSCTRDRSVHGQKDVWSPAIQSTYLHSGTSLQRMNLCRCCVKF